MLPIPFLLVVASTITHAWWNYLAKTALDKDIFLGSSKILQMAIFLPLYLYFLWRDGLDWQHWPWIAGGALLIFAYYLLLGQAYRHIDLSIAYPIARSSTLFLPFLAYLFIGETIDWVGGVAVALVIAGVLLIQLPAFSWSALAQVGRQLRQPGILFALGTAFVVACYTLWDKMAVTHIRPFLYYYSYSLLTALFYALLLRRFPPAARRREWDAHKKQMALVAILDLLTYVMVLIAISSSKATYTGALRQISLAIGVFFGWKLLHEPLPRPKITAVALLILGGTLTLFAR